METTARFADAAGNRSAHVFLAAPDATAGETFRPQPAGNRACSCDAFRAGADARHPKFRPTRAVRWPRRAQTFKIVCWFFRRAAVSIRRNGQLATATKERKSS
jgi:hypothetical protein